MLKKKELAENLKRKMKGTDLSFTRKEMFQVDGRLHTLYKTKQDDNEFSIRITPEGVFFGGLRLTSQADLQKLAHTLSLAWTEYKYSFAPKIIGGDTVGETGDAEAKD